MDTTKITYGDILYFEDGRVVLVGPPSGDHNDWSLKYSTIEIRKDDYNCRAYYEFHTIENLLAFYVMSGKVVKIVNINKLI